MSPTELISLAVSGSAICLSVLIGIVVVVLVSTQRPRPAISVGDRRALAEGPHAALHAKLQRLRQPGDRPSS